MAFVMNADKSILRSISTICFRRCVQNFDREHLNALEQSCVDRCTSKYDQMLRHVVSENAALKV